MSTRDIIPFLLCLLVGHNEWEQREKDGKVIPSDAQSTVGIAVQWGGFLTFPNVSTLLLLLCVFPVTTCTCERCVSAFRRVKTFLRTSFGQELKLLGTLTDNEGAVAIIAEVFLD